MTTFTDVTDLPEGLAVATCFIDNSIEHIPRICVETILENNRGAPRQVHKMTTLTDVPDLQ